MTDFSFNLKMSLNSKHEKVDKNTLFNLIDNISIYCSICNWNEAHAKVQERSGYNLKYLVFGAEATMCSDRFNT